MKTCLHTSLRQITKKSYAEFLQQRRNLRVSQLKILQSLLKASQATDWGREHGVKSDWSYDKMAHSFPLTTWGDWEGWVEKQLSTKSPVMTHSIERFQPTSGSTHKRKWIPYSKQFLAEIDHAVAAWIHDIYQSYPATLKGSHYWSLSWLPEDLRKKMSNNDLAYFSFAKKLLLSKIMAIPATVEKAESSEVARTLTLSSLAQSRDLSLVSVWSPTFFLGLCDDLYQERRRFAPQVSGENQREFLQNLWPNLALVSAWDTADAKPWAQRVKELLPHTAFQGKGLFATEGVVTIPIQGQMHLAYRSHFYEFKKTSGEIIPAWELKPGDRVMPLLSTGSGLWRYEMGDEVEVEALVDGCPVLQFLGRRNTVDMVGEKMSQGSARELLSLFGSRAILLLAIQGDADRKPRYELVVEGETPEPWMLRAEEELLRHYHYKLARELNQLAPLTVRHCLNSQKFFQDLSHEMKWVLGDQKWEALVRVPREPSKECGWKR